MGVGGGGEGDGRTWPSKFKRVVVKCLWRYCFVYRFLALPLPIGRVVFTVFACAVFLTTLCWLKGSFADACPTDAS